MPALVDVHMQFITESFGGTQAEMLAALTKAAGDLKVGSGSPVMKDLMVKVGTQLNDDIDCLSSLARWIALSVPMVETGGQWGADVQSHVLGIITKANDKLKANLETLPNYYKDRGEALKKVVPSVSRKSSSSTTKSNTVRTPAPPPPLLPTDSTHPAAASATRGAMPHCAPHPSCCPSTCSCACDTPGGWQGGGRGPEDSHVGVELDREYRVRCAAGRAGLRGDGRPQVVQQVEADVRRHDGYARHRV
jgi:hypothetical protein